MGKDLDVARHQAINKRFDNRTLEQPPKAGRQPAGAGVLAGDRQRTKVVCRMYVYQLWTRCSWQEHHVTPSDHSVRAGSPTRH